MDSLLIKAGDLADYIVKKSNNDKKLVTNLQLQKILFYIQRYFIVNKNKVIFEDDIEAWKFGPVVPPVYYEYSSYGSLPIFQINNDVKDVKKILKEKLNDAELEIIDNIIEEKREKNAWDLVAETHKPGGSWDRIYNDLSNFTKIISNEDIKKYEA